MQYGKNPAAQQSRADFVKRVWDIDGGLFQASGCLGPTRWEAVHYLQLRRLKPGEQPGLEQVERSGLFYPGGRGIYDALGLGRTGSRASASPPRFQRFGFSQSVRLRGAWGHLLFGDHPQARRAYTHQISVWLRWQKGGEAPGAYGVILGRWLCLDLYPHEHPRVVSQALADFLFQELRAERVPELLRPSPDAELHWLIGCFWPFYRYYS